MLGMEEERALPLTDSSACVQVDHVLNLSMVSMVLAFLRLSNFIV